MKTKVVKVKAPKRPRLERDIENDVVDYAVRHLGAEHRKMNGLGKRHWPDRLILLSRCPELWIEFKKPGEEPTPGQWEQIRRLRAQGREVWIEDDAKLCIAKLNAWYVLKTGEAKRDELAAEHRRGLGIVPSSSIPRGVIVDRRTVMCNHKFGKTCKHCRG